MEKRFFPSWLENLIIVILLVFFIRFFTDEKELNITISLYYLLPIIMIFNSLLIKWTKTIFENSNYFVNIYSTLFSVIVFSLFIKNQILIEKTSFFLGEKIKIITDYSQEEILSDGTSIHPEIVLGNKIYYTISYIIILITFFINLFILYYYKDKMKKIIEFNLEFRKKNSPYQKWKDSIEYDENGKVKNPFQNINDKSGQ